MGAKSVIAVLGQSNALGFGRGWKPLTLDRPSFRVSQYAVFGPVRGMVFPFTEPALGPRPKIRTVGAAATFARVLVRATGGRAMLVPVAVGSVGFSNPGQYAWSADAVAPCNLYKLSVESIRGALEKDSRNELSAVIWQQGEQDVNMDVDAYRAKLVQVFEGIRAEFGPVPIIIGGMSPDWIAAHTETQGVDRIHRETAETMPGVAFVPGPSGMTNPGELVHYSAEGQRELGHRMWDAYVELGSRRVVRP